MRSTLKVFDAISIFLVSATAMIKSADRTAIKAANGHALGIVGRMQMASSPMLLSIENKNNVTITAA